MSEKKVEKNKRLKKERLEEAGYECFLEYSFEKQVSIKSSKKQVLQREHFIYTLKIKRAIESSHHQEKRNYPTRSSIPCLQL